MNPSYCENCGVETFNSYLCRKCSNAKTGLDFIFDYGESKSFVKENGWDAFLNDFQNEFEELQLGSVSTLLYPLEKTRRGNFMKTVWNEVAVVAENLLSIYEQLVELSHEIEYIHDKTENAGDDLKNIVADMMDELQKLKPLDY